MRRPIPCSSHIAVVAADPLVAARAERVGPSPVRMTTPIVGSSRASSNARISSRVVSGRKALRTSGRSIVIFAMPVALVSYRMSVYSPFACHSTI